MDKRIRQGLACGVVIGAAAASASAQTGPDLLLGTFGEGHNVVVQGDAFLFDNGSTSNDEGARLDIFNTSGRAKLDLDSVYKGINRAQPRVGYQLTHIATNSNDPNLPDQMTDMSVGVGLGVAKGEKWVAGLSIGLGYASATTFGDANAYYGKADFAVAYQINPDERIGFVLDYNGNRTFKPDWPLPGVIYTRKVSDQITVEVGFPYSDIEYKPDDHWTLMFKYLFPDGGEANISYGITPALHVYAGLQQQTAAFHWNQLGNGADRVLFSQNRVEVGIRGEYGHADMEGINANAFIAVGYAFGTQFDYGYETGDSTRNLADLSDEPYLRIGFELKF